MNKSLLAASLALSLTVTSCLGPDNLYGSLKNWNAEVAADDPINELIFLGMIIVPIYPLALAGDVLIFNTIGYWTGENPIADPGPFPGFTQD